MNLPKQIKIANEHANAIEAAQAEVNGTADKHAFTTYRQIADLADLGDQRLTQMGLPTRAYPGATVICTSGEQVANSYRRPRNGTRVRLGRRSGGWYLVAAERVALWPRDHFRCDLHLTADQDAEAVRRLRQRYSAPSALPPSMPEEDFKRLAASLDPSTQRVVEWLLPKLTQSLEDEVRAIIGARDARAMAHRVLAEVCADAV